MLFNSTFESSCELVYSYLCIVPLQTVQQCQTLITNPLLTQSTAINFSTSVVVATTTEPKNINILFDQESRQL